MRRIVAAGQNPVEQKRRQRAEAGTKTFAALAERYLQEHARRFKRSASTDERNLSLHVLPQWGKRRFDEIQRRDVIALCEEMVAAGTPTNANRVQALVSSIFSFAVDADLLPGNPCSRLRKRAPENVDRRVLSDAEITLFWHRIVGRPVSRPIGLALRIALLTGCRVSEIAEAEISEFHELDDAQQAAWVIPARRSKNGRAHYLPLTQLAREIVAEAVQLAGSNSRFLFPSPVRRERPITGHALSVAMQRFGNNVDDDGPAMRSWRQQSPSPHDLRRTVATRIAGLGFPAEDVSAVLNHTRRDVTGRHYDHYDRAREKRQVLTAWDAMLGALIAMGSSDSPQ
jgi:integrase